jgi:hypothetical protein
VVMASLRIDEPLSILAVLDQVGLKTT